MRLNKNCLKLQGLFFSWLIFTLLFPKLGYSQKAEIANYPTRPITLIIHLPPGNNTDLSARLIAKEAEKYLGQPVIPVNKPGGTMTIGTAAVASAKPDGYTIGLSLHSPQLIVPHLEKVPYHPVKDLRQVMQFSGFNFGIFVKQDSSFKDFKDVVAYARQSPKKLTYASTANSMQYFIMEQIAHKEKVQFSLIPFKGTPEIEIATLGGHTLIGLGDFNYSLLEAGQTRLLVLLKEERSAEYPQMPILKDLGYDIPCPMFMGLLGPKGLPEEIVKKLEEAFTSAMKEPAFINGMKELHVPIVYRKSKELADYVSHHYEFFGKVLREMGSTKP